MNSNKRKERKSKERERGFTLYVYKTAPALLSARKNVFVSFVGWLYVLALLYEWYIKEKRKWEERTRVSVLTTQALIFFINDVFAYGTLTLF